MICSSVLLAHQFLSQLVTGRAISASVNLWIIHLQHHRQHTLMPSTCRKPMLICMAFHWLMRCVALSSRLASPASDYVHTSQICGNAFACSSAQALTQQFQAQHLQISCRVGIDCQLQIHAYWQQPVSDAACRTRCLKEPVSAIHGLSM